MFLVVLVFKVQQFKFNDARLSFDELKERASSEPTPNDQLLDLSDSQKETLFDLFEPRPSADAAIRVIDKDGSGTISAEDVAAVNDATDPMTNPSLLKLTDAQHEAIGARFNHQPAPNVADSITTRYTGVATNKNDDGKQSTSTHRF